MSLLSIPRQAIIDVIIVLILCVPLLVIHLVAKPVPTGFWCGDQSLGYPYKPDTVTQSLLLILSFGGPFFVMAITESIRATLMTQHTDRIRTQLFSMTKSYGVFLFGVVATIIFTETLKYSVGRLRPHFFDVCRPDFAKINCTADNGQDRFIMHYECTNKLVDQKLLKDSRLSFPSGHASVSMYSAFFTVFYLQLRMEASFSHLLRPVMQLGVMLLALLCAVTRITDHKHFGSDVIAGSALGVSLAWLSFYKIGQKVIPTRPSEKPGRFPRALSVESEPETPTPLLRPERLIINHPNTHRNGNAPRSKDEFSKAKDETGSNGSRGSKMNTNLYQDNVHNV